MPKLSRPPITAGTSTNSPVPWKLIACLFAVAVAVHFPAIANDFVSYNDWVYIVFNPDNNPVTLQTFTHLWTRPCIGLYQPMCGTLGALIAMMAHLPAPNPSITASGGLFDPHIFHFASVTVHAIDTVLVFLLLRRIVSSDGACLIGALLFAVHPMQVESVAWASASDRLFCVMFSIPALLLYVRTPDDYRRKAFNSFYIGAVALGILAVLCKPTAIVLPLIALVLDRALLHRSWKQSLLAYAPWQLAIMPILFMARQAADPSDVPPAVALWSRLFVAGDTVAFNLGKSLLPTGLSLDYGRTPQFVLAHWWGFATWIFPVIVALAAWRFTRQGDPIRTGLLIFGIALVPTIGLVPFPSQMVSTVADRYIYPAMPGLSLIVAALIGRLAAHQHLQKPIYAIAGVWLVVLAVLTIAHIPVWSDGISLMQNTLRANPASYNALTYLGKDYELGGQYDKALPMFAAACKIRPTYYQPHYNLATVYEKIGELDSAIDQLKAAIGYAPQHTESDIELGNCYLKKHEIDLAKNAYIEAVRMRPTDSFAYYDLGNIANNEQDYGAARQYFSIAIRLSPNDALAHAHLAKILVIKGDLSGAQSESQMALHLALNARERGEVASLLSH